MKKFSMWLATLGVAVLGALSLTGCQKMEPSQAPTQAAAGPAFRILAGSELKDVADDIVAFGQSKGVAVQFDYSGSLDAVDKLTEAHSYDAVWLSHGKYPQLVPQVRSQIKTSEKTMYSRVVLGVKPEKAKELGWNLAKSNQVSWKDIIVAVKSGKLKLAMTNPAGSNTGFVTLVGVAAELSGKGDALEEQDIPGDKLKELFSGISLTSGSSGDLADKFKADPAKADAIVNYEASILQMGKAGMPLAVVIPKEGVITADYPLMLLNQSKQQPFYEQLVAHVRDAATQKRIAETTLRTPLAGDASEQVVNELPFPSSLKVVDALLEGYLNKYAKATTSYFVLDVSGSMNGSRMDSAKQMMTSLTQSDGSVSGRFSTFRNQEKVYLTPFSNVVYQTSAFELSTDKAANQATLTSIAQTVNNLRADGGTAIYDAIGAVYAQAQSELKAGKRNVSIVLLTDGENNNGISLEQLLQHIDSQGAPRVPVFGILYGEANVGAMQALTSRTGGRAFDARKVSLKSVMKAIRNYQ